MRTAVAIAIVLALLPLVACGPQPSPTTLPPAPVSTEVSPTRVPAATQVPPTALPAPTAEPAVELPPPTMEPTPLRSHPGLPLPDTRGDLVGGSGVCAVCHTNMVDESGADVSVDAFWRSTMMANAARDPYWQATVRSEVHHNAAYQAVIEDKCATCHMPMARLTAFADGGQGWILDTGFLAADHGLHTLALDGVSCTVCHQIEDSNFGQSDSFSGGYTIPTDLPLGERSTFGPYPAAKADVRIMQTASGFVPTQSLHVERSELCATCHTLYTPYVDSAGQIAGEFPEQTVYLEWLASDYRGTRNCQICHMPTAQGAVNISTVGGKPRSPFAQHVFVAGNVMILRTLATFGPDLETTASTGHFEATIERALDMLQSRTAGVAVEDTQLADSTLSFDLVVTNQVGHKLPSGFPSRRAWLHVRVRDGSGRLLFDSGAFGADGAIAGNDNDTDPAAYEPHYQEITDPSQVQIYEAIMQDTEGEVTTVLLRAAGYVKDNRLLPAGFVKGQVPQDIAVYGQAVEDIDFVGGGDRVRYTVDVGDAQGPFEISADLLYQSIGYRWAQNLRAIESPETARFLQYYEAIPNVPVTVARTLATGGE